MWEGVEKLSSWAPSVLKVPNSSSKCGKLPEEQQFCFEFEGK
jgi:hypothetical protein